MPAKILIIDDDQDFIEILKLRLLKVLKDPEFTVFGDLAAAQAYLKDRPLLQDLIIIDEHLPDGRGSDLIRTGVFVETAVLSVSSDPNPQITAKSVGSGATFFMSKEHVREELFEQLILGLLQRNLLAKSLHRATVKLATVDTAKKMISTLRHEINNPLAAIIGALYILKRSVTDQDGKEAVNLIEIGSNRIREVIEKLQLAKELSNEKKSSESVFQIPGDKPWGKK